MRIRRSLPILLGVVLVAVALVLVVQLRKHAPPEPARLLPAADGFFYVNLQWIRRIKFAGQLPSVSHDPEYEQFIQATGFQFERDLEQAAFAVHYPPAGTAQGAPRPPRFSEVLVGRIQGQRLREYLGKISSSVDSYHSTDIYNIPLEGRTLRVAILGVDTVAASNHGDPQVIRGIVDRSRKLASPFGGPTLLKQHYKDVPLASLAWVVFRVDPASAQSPPGPVSLSFLFSKPAVVLASARYLGTLDLRAEAFTGSEDEAKRVAEELTTFLGVFHTVENAAPTQGTDPDVKAFFDSLQVERHGDRAVLKATLPPGFIRKALAEYPPEIAPKAPPTIPAPAPKAGRKPQKADK
jgi:hypothetical protein